MSETSTHPSQKIVQLTAENVKRITVVEITPDPSGSMVIIGGDNGNGKSSVLDAIQMALGGKDEIPEVPIRRGASKARVVVKTDDYVIERTFTGTGTQLVVKGPDGLKVSSPQTLLDSLTSSISFDPLSFQRMDADKQAAKLRALAGLDFTELDAKRKALYETRTDANRDVKTQQVRCDQLVRHPDVPAAEVSTAEVLAKLEAANQANAAIAEKRTKLTGLNDRIEEHGEAVTRAQKEVDRLTAELMRAEQALKDARIKEAEVIADRDELAKQVQTLQDIDVEPIKAELAQLGETNKKVQANAQWKAEQQKLVELTKRAASLTEQIEQIDKAKSDQIAAAKFPVTGLGFEDDRVTFNGLPFDQASAAEQLRASVAIGFAMQPRLKIALIRDGSLLDDKSLALVAQTAAENGGTVWIERVGHGAECSVVLEDGLVKEDRTEAGKAVEA